MMLSAMMASSSRHVSMRALSSRGHPGTASIFTSVTAVTAHAITRTGPIMMMAIVGRNHIDISNGMTKYMSTTTTTTSSDGKPPLWSSNHKHFPLPNAKGSVIYTETDEAPALATYSLYPVVSKVRICCIHSVSFSSGRAGFDALLAAAEITIIHPLLSHF
jgi:hypothetical protein